MSSATAAVFFAMDFTGKKAYQLGEYWHSNESMRHKESAELASDIVSFFTKFQEQPLPGKLGPWSLGGRNPGFKPRPSVLGARGT